MGMNSDNNFWRDRKKPLYCLAPMEDVTDTVFREVVLRLSDMSNPPILYTEFTSTDGLMHQIGRGKVIHRLQINPSERELLRQNGIPLVAQIWGSNPDYFHAIAKELSDSGDFDGIDINMGCPVKKIVKQASCSALIAFPELAREIIQATQEAAQIPVSVKTRTGLKKHQTEDWIPTILSCKPAALILHARTQQMMSDFPAEWDQLAIAAELRNQISPDTVLIGNGDVFSVEDAHRMVNDFHVDGVMIGRGIFKNPWIFRQSHHDPDREERLRALWMHTDLYERTWKGEKSFNLLKRFFKIYAQAFPNAAEFRARLMETHSAAEVRKVIDDFLLSAVDINLD
jgi:nifR3 family TIM-barrel protein